MKVGIVTFHRAHNFGAVLQCFALKTVLESLGHDVHVIDHRNDAIERCYNLISRPYYRGSLPYSVRSMVSNIIKAPISGTRMFRFNSFIYKYILDNKHTGGIWNGYDCIVWGSDQIWQWNIIRDDLCFWGEIPNKDVKKITYAASAGKLNEQFENNIPYLANFKKISVREKDLKTHLSEKGIDSEVVIDPTLLLTKEEWERHLPLKTLETSPYLLVYSMRNPKATLEMARKVAAKKGLRIVEIFNNYFGIKDYLQKYNAAGPIEYVSLFRNADFIVTDSFHGTAFSVIFNRQFITLRHNDGHDNRAASLLESVGLSDRHVAKTDSLELDAIDYTKPNKQLVEDRKSVV